MAGRRPKPTALKLVTGNPGKRPLPEGGAVPPEGDIVMPKFLKGRKAEVELWNEFAPICRHLGTLTIADTRTLANWCVAQAEFDKVKMKMKAADKTNLRAWAAILGLDATSRVRIGTVGRKTKDPADEFFNAAS